MIDIAGPEGVVCIVERIDAIAIAEMLRVEDSLAPEVRSRVHAAAGSQRRRMLAARAIAHRCVAQASGLDDLVIAQRCDRCGSNGHGRPQVKDYPVDVSWAHSAMWVAAAASVDRQVGVDVEDVPRARPGLSLIERALTPQERGPEGDVGPLPFARLWTAKEAMVKLGLLELDDFGTTDVEVLARWSAVEVHASAVADGTVAVAVAATQPAHSAMR
ncbi:4'-phosphopantetheinyl transferase superfamily [Mycobacteroides abscessus subsp. abscessus]|nr:4'-phosphopantetheinyl transferase superfamily [Mycobacteroides abscessus subsp. abscessus]